MFWILLILGSVGYFVYKQKFMEKVCDAYHTAYKVGVSDSRSDDYGKNYELPDSNKYVKDAYQKGYFHGFNRDQRDSLYYIEWKYFIPFYNPFKEDTYFYFSEAGTKLYLTDMGGHRKDPSDIAKNPKARKQIERLADSQLAKDIRNKGSVTVDEFGLPVDDGNESKQKKVSDIEIEI